MVVKSTYLYTSMEPEIKISSKRIVDMSVLSEEEFKSVNKKENNVNFEFKVIDLFK